tara:strand:- start:956 stop:1744 length:789 start_codon:yes stop_codon:yes gene_type:complete
MKEYGVALVTGAGSGIGRETAIKLAEKGARVIVTDISEAGINETVERIKSLGGKALGKKLDVTNADDIDDAFATAEQWDKYVDILVNNAGIVNIQGFLDYTPQNWHQVISVNLTGSFLCAQRAARDMKKQSYGRIINMSSVSGLRAGVGRTAYGTTKAAIIGLTRQIALEMGPHGITANAIAPGPIKTPLVEATYSEETIARLLPMIPVGRFGDCSDIAEAVCYLADPKTGYVNGEILTVDGGYYASGMTQTGTLDLEESKG